MKKKARMVLLYIMIILFFSSTAKATPRCSCGDDRWLKLQEPLIYGHDVREIQTQLKNIGILNQPLTVYMIRLLPKLSRIFKRQKV